MLTLVTGASGFIGSALCARLLRDKTLVRAAVRSLGLQPDSVETVVVESLSSETDWSKALRRVDQVVHLAARVHVMSDKGSDPLAEFRRVNVEGTVALARQAAASGVRRFVFLSTVKVNGEYTENGKSFTADDFPRPEDPYGISKYEAEQRLFQIAAETGIEVVIIRPPLVYGPGVKANFKSMLSCLALGVPLPLSGITYNRRSLVALDNLVDLIVTCLYHPAAANQVFMVSDGEDLSTVGILDALGSAMRRSARLFYLPPGILKLSALVARKPDIYRRLCGSLQVDITKTRKLLGWVPPVSVDEAMRLATKGFRR